MNHQWDHIFWPAEGDAQWMLHVIMARTSGELFTVLAYPDPAEIWNRRPKPPKENDSKATYSDSEQAKPTAMSYYARIKRKKSGGRSCWVKTEFPGRVGLTWTRSQHNNVSNHQGGH